MRLYEYQAKQALRAEGIRTPRGECVTSPEQARQVAQEIGKPVAVKAQIWATGRFKAGGIKFADTPEMAEQSARELIHTTIKSFRVDQVLVEEKLAVEKEFYLGIIVSDSYRAKCPVVIFSTEGGVDIEQVAAATPDRVVKTQVDYLHGVGALEAAQLLAQLPPDDSLPLDLSTELIPIITQLWNAFRHYDARSIEINPLVRAKDGCFYAADCRVVIDDNSVFRHPEFSIRVPRDMERPATELEQIAWAIEDGDYRGTGYFAQMVPQIEGKGWLGFHGIGGGGAMLGASAFVARGFRLANYADTSGDPTASKVYKVVKCIFSQPIDGYVLMGACLANQEQWHHAHALVKALREEAPQRPGFPVVLLLAGNREKEAHEIIRNGLRDVPLRWELYGRDHIYDTDFIANRVHALVHEYQQEKYGE